MALALALVAPSAMAAGTSAPLAVSPASDAGLALVEARCPTFSWTSVANQDGYELVVYRLEPATLADAKVAAQPVLSVHVPAAANSWTPTLERCLAVGERYAWSIRPHGSQGQWSEPSFFEIAPPVSQAALQQAVALLRGELSDGTSTAAAGGQANAVLAPRATATTAATSRPSPGKATQGTPTFAVDGNGNVSATSVSAGNFTGAGGGLTGVNAVTAAALASNGANCGAGQVPIGIDASGNAEGCLGVLFPADLDAHASGGAHDARYLQLTGGTLTGPLTATAFQGDGSALTGVVASTAQSLAANGANCTPGTAPSGVNASGAAEDCFDVTTDSELITHLVGGDHDSRYLRLSGGTLTGALSAPSFSGNGAALTNVAAATALQANNATTANALSANPANCGAGNATTGVAANGAAEGCFDVATQSELNLHASAGDSGHDGRYLRQTGGTLTGPLTMNGTTSGDGTTSLTIDGAIFSRCPKSTPVFGQTATMDRVGSWCIDHLNRSSATGTNAMLTCHNAGMQLCPIDVYALCDAANIRNGVTGSCGEKTDDGSITIRSGSLDRTGTGSAYDQFLKYEPNGNRISAAADSDQLLYYCCRSISAY